MSFTFTNRNGGTNTTAGTSVTYTCGTGIAAGSLMVLVACYDNAGSGGADPYSSISDSKGNTWTSRHNTLRDPGAANAGIVLRIFTTRQNAATLQNGDTVTISFGSTNVTVKSLAMWEVSSSAGYADYDSTGTGAVGASTSPSVTSGTVAVGKAIIGAVAYEYGQASSTADSDTTNGSWSSGINYYGGSTTSGNSVMTQYKVQTTADSTQTYNVGYANSSDWAAGYIIVKEVPLVSVSAPVATVSVSTLAATASGLVVKEVSAPVATVTVATYDPTEAVQASAPAATATGATLAASVSSFPVVSVTAPVAAVSVATLDATAQILTSTVVDAPLATVTADAYSATAAVQPGAPVATVSVSTQTATVSAFPVKTVSAPVATVTTATEWGGGGGTTTVGQDSFTESSSTALTSHTPEVGTAWTADYTGLAGGAFVNATTDRLDTPIPPEFSGEEGGGEYVISPDITGEVDVYLTSDDAYSAGPIVRHVSSTTNYRVTGFDTSLTLWRRTAGSWYIIASGAKSAGAFRIRVNVSGSSPTALKVRSWLTSGSEGETWAIDTTDNTAANQNATGKVGLNAFSYDDSEGFIGAVTVDDFLATTPGGGGSAVGPTVQIAPYPGAATVAAAGQSPAAQVQVFPSAATVSVAAQTATVSISAGTTVYPDTATVAASAQAPTSQLAVFPAAGSVSAAALAPTARMQAYPSAANVTAASLAPTSRVQSHPSAATVTTDAKAPVSLVQAHPSAATATAAAQAPTAQTFPTVTASAPVATVTAAGVAPGVFLHAFPSVATVTGDALQATVSTTTGNTTVYPDAATVSATAQAPTVMEWAFAPTATVTASGQSALPIVSPMPATATATAAGQTPTARVQTFPSTATVTTGTPTATAAVGALAPVATATASAASPTARVQAFAPTATAAATALAPTAGMWIWVSAALATVTVAAHAPTVTVAGIVSYTPTGWAENLSPEAGVFGVPDGLVVVSPSPGTAASGTVVGVVIESPVPKV